VTDRAEILALPGATWVPEYLEDTSLRRLVLDHYDQEHIALRRYASFLGLNPQTCEDIVQESFLKLHEHLAAGGSRANLRAWLYKVVHNLARNGQTAFRSARTDSLDFAKPNGDLRADEPTVEQTLIAEERVQRLRKAMEELSPAQRGCVLLRTQGLKYREIAEVLNISVSTVGENVQRGLERLKELL
jgi:RNA polymerase sigma-70 factor (ECF subfamily)